MCFGSLFDRWIASMARDARSGWSIYLGSWGTFADSICWACLLCRKAMQPKSTANEARFRIGKSFATVWGRISPCGHVRRRTCHNYDSFRLADRTKRLAVRLRIPFRWIVVRVVGDWNVAVYLVFICICRTAYSSSHWDESHGWVNSH